MSPFESNSTPPNKRWEGVLALAGPTASGKTAVAMQLAETLGGEIVSVDSMQVYRGMDIGTAKPGPAERERFRHHLIDVVDIAKPFDAAQFVARAQTAIADIQSRGRLAILCGGTGLYFKALFYGLGDAPPTDPELRGELEKLSLKDLLHEIETRDPELYAKIDRQNPRRVVRAVEVLRLSGKPFSEQRAAWKNQEGIPKLFCLRREQADLHARINARVDEMFRAGLVEETRQLLAAGLNLNPTAMQALGCRQVVEHLEGKCGLPETIELVKTKTRQFAKRQVTWFKAQPNVLWVDVPPSEAIKITADRVRSFWPIT
jgi:tRNA dimethylallyltransferase